MKIFLLIFSIISAISAKSCVHEWRSYHGNLEPYVDGISAGDFKPDTPAFIGRGTYDDLIVIGRIQTKDPAGLYHISGRALHHIVDGIQYLVRNPNYNYKWVFASNGQYVENAVYPGYTPSREVHTVGRFRKGDQTFLGKVIPNNAIHYEDNDGNEIDEYSNYEVLTCTVPE